MAKVLFDRPLKLGAAAALGVMLMVGSAAAMHGRISATAVKPKPKRASKSAKPSIPVSSATLEPSFTYSGASIVANGASLRNRASSTINLSGLPTDATILQAFLYWDFTSINAANVGSLQNTVCFNPEQENDSGGDGGGEGGDALGKLSSTSDGSGDGGDDVCDQGSAAVGTLIGTGADACWAGGNNVAFRADVTKEITGNGRYTVALQPGAASTESGIDPLDPTSPTTGPYAEGASLVAVFTSKTIAGGNVLVYDSGLAATEFVSTTGLTYKLDAVPAPGTGSSIFTEIGADGQAGSGLLNFGATKNTSLNSILVAGPGSPANDADWNGTDGVPLIQLWDTHSHDVTGDLVTGLNTVSIFDSISPAANGDCLIGIANVLTVR
jgi:hypothetical protein